MSILRKLNNLIDEESQSGRFKVPTVAKPDNTGLTLKKCVVLSALLHPTVLALCFLLVFILMMLGINIFLLDRPASKTQDIEFVLVDKEAMPINRNTKYRADRNSRAGGKHNPKKKVSMPSPSAKKSPTTAASATQKLMKKVAKQQAQQAQQAKNVAQKTQSQPAPAKKVVSAPPKPAQPTSRPSYAPPSVPKVVAEQRSPIGLPAPPTLAPTGKTYSTGPVSGSGTRSGGSSARSGSGSGNTLGYSGSSRSTGSAGSRGSAGSSGSLGNPGPGNPNGPWGIDALREPNFAPYMRELQSRIKYNWDPPKGNESKRVVLMFRIAKNGQLLSNRVFKSSGLQAADRAALNAVSVSAPFKPLPAEFRGQHIDIQFTFDYNVFGATGY